MSVGYDPTEAAERYGEIDRHVAEIERAALALDSVLTDHGVAVKPIIDEARIARRLLHGIVTRRLIRE